MVGHNTGNLHGVPSHFVAWIFAGIVVLCFCSTNDLQTGDLDPVCMQFASAHFDLLLLVRAGVAARLAARLWQVMDDEDEVVEQTDHVPHPNTDQSWSAWFKGASDAQAHAPSVAPDQPGRLMGQLIRFGATLATGGFGGGAAINLGAS